MTDDQFERITEQLTNIKQTLETIRHTLRETLLWVLILLALSSANCGASQKGYGRGSVSRRRSAQAPAPGARTAVPRTSPDGVAATSSSSSAPEVERQFPSPQQ